MLVARRRWYCPGCRGRCSERYLAAALIRPGFVAAVTPSRIYWMRAAASGFTWTHTTRADLPAAVACFASPQTQELLVVCGDGTLGRVAIPG